ncbi:acyl-CoA dehydrogenase family protein [Actinocorallia sp. A-T 12471]|uniref:acyl-CoA dehydrogenase family protein n=1 Tax=Actinocorallia sp. A-T 12471 TaxID=3089813 RepID=UPI0029D2E12D|nr:acyl-CoA dehydrogenase family protein [Actinocorallia sp. A-T 12471]MDX6740938.1 acyl-CoA dehydrogenase family protein [Actinocorallia sp. A-T 12471]
MDLMPSADQRDLRAGLRAWLADAWDAERLRAAAAVPAPPFDRKAWKALADLGVLGLTLSEEDGGMGLGLADAVLVFEELGRALVPGPLVGTFLAAGLVPGAAEGDAVVAVVDTGEAVAVVEHPEAATDVLVLDDSGVYLLAPGDVAGPPAAHPLDPLTPVAPAASIRLDGARRVGDAADAARLRRFGRILTAALQVGVAQGALDLAVRYAGERVQFDRVIGSFQSVKHLLAEALVRVDLARPAVLVAALTVDDPGSGDPGEAAATAKLLADAAASGNGRTGVQVHGGMGFTWEVLAHLYVKRAWVQETAFGTAAALAEELAAGIG